jgi:hypothetical protein
VGQGKKISKSKKKEKRKRGKMDAKGIAWWIGAWMNESTKQGK